MESPFFSVIIPSYNRANFITTAIKSVQNQTFSDWELILIDDGSTDNTKEVVESLSVEDDRIRYIYQENAERSAARNNGIQQAEGRYICFLDSDDYYLPERLQVLHAAITEANLTKACFYTGIQFEKNGIAKKRPELARNGSPILDFIVQAIIGTPQMCIHKDLLEHHLFNTNINIGEDQELWLRILNEHDELIFVDDYSIVAVDHDDRSVNEFRANAAALKLKMLNVIFTKGHPGYQISNSVKNRILSNSYFGQARYFIHKAKRFSALKHLVKSIVLNPAHPQTKHKIYLILKQFTPSGAAIFVAF